MYGSGSSCALMRSGRLRADFIRNAELPEVMARGLHVRLGGYACGRAADSSDKPAPRLNITRVFSGPMRSTVPAPSLSRRPTGNRGAPARNPNYPSQPLRRRSRAGEDAEDGQHDRTVSESRYTSPYRRPDGMQTPRQGGYASPGRGGRRGGFGPRRGGYSSRGRGDRERRPRASERDGPTPKVEYTPAEKRYLDEQATKKRGVDTEYPVEDPTPRSLAEVWPELPTSAVAQRESVEAVLRRLAGDTINQIRPASETGKRLADGKVVHLTTKTEAATVAVEAAIHAIRIRRLARREEMLRAGDKAAEMTDEELLALEMEELKLLDVGYQGVEGRGREELLRLFVSGAYEAEMEGTTMDEEEEGGVLGGVKRVLVRGGTYRPVEVERVVERVERAGVR
ncbi:MAG: hypothetical protein M1817_005096 [Caeruleum heppii]|nr:MAG: hypothetical protein M1817_005096 [Caeruleum heppii]